MMRGGRLRLWSGVVCAAMLSVPDAVAEPIGDPSAGYRQVQRAFLREEFTQVTHLAGAYVTKFPDATDTPRVRIWLALSLDRLGRGEEALRQLDAGKARLAPADPLWPEALYWEGDIGRRSGQTVRAKHAFTRVVTQFSDSPWTLQARLGLGLVYFSQQVIPEALEWFREVANTAPAGAPVALQARLMEAICDVRLHEFESAAAKIHRLLELLQAPEDIAQASFYLGEAWSGLARYEEALGAYQRATESLPTSRWATLSKFGQGWASFRLGRYREATTTLTEYVETTDEEPRPEALYALGSCWFQLGREAQAEPPLQRLIAQYPRHALAAESGLLLADAFRRQRRLTEAAALLASLLGTVQDARGRAQFQVQLGSIRLDQGREPEARALFDGARASPDREGQQAAVNGLGDVEMFLGRDDDAERYYEAVRQISSQGLQVRYARYQLGRIRLLRGDAAGALEVFRGLLAETDGSLRQDVELAMALAWLHQRNEAMARTQLQQLRRNASDRAVSARAAYYLALLALTEGDEPQTRRLCQEAQRGAPGSDEALEARLLLVELDRGSSSEHTEELRALFREPNQPSRHRGKLAKTLGDLSRHGGDYPQAIRWYDEAVQLWPALAGEASYAIASCYEEGGDIETAISRYRLVVQRAWMVRGQLAAAKLLERQGKWRDAAAVYESLADQPIPEAKVAREQWSRLRDGR